MRGQGRVAGWRVVAGSLVPGDGGPTTTVCDEPYAVTRAENPRRATRLCRARPFEARTATGISPPTRAAWVDARRGLHSPVCGSARIPLFFRYLTHARPYPQPPPPPFPAGTHPPAAMSRTVAPLMLTYGEAAPTPDATAVARQAKLAEGDFDEDSKPRHECGVFGVFSSVPNASRVAFFALYALNHRACAGVVGDVAALRRVFCGLHLDPRSRFAHSPSLPPPPTRPHSHAPVPRRRPGERGHRVVRHGGHPRAQGHGPGVAGVHRVGH